MRKSACWAWMGLLAVFTVDGVFAQGGLKDMPPGKWWTNKRVIAQIRLSQDQQSKIEALWTLNRNSLIDQKAELEKRQLDLSELVARDSIDEGAALKAFDRVQEARLSLERSTFLMRIQIKNLLSPEQQQKLETIAELLRQQKAKGNDPAGTAPAKPPSKKSGGPYL